MNDATIYVCIAPTEGGGREMRTCVRSWRPYGDDILKMKVRSFTSTAFAALVSVAEDLELKLEVWTEDRPIAEKLAADREAQRRYEEDCKARKAKEEAEAAAVPDAAADLAAE